MNKNSKRYEQSFVTISGYIRRISLIVFPKELVDVIVLFYHAVDEWDPNCIGDSMAINEEENSVYKTSSGHKSAFCVNVAESGIHHWKFKLIECGGDDWNSLIGIWNVKHSD
eukprot:319642_1